MSGERALLNSVIRPRGWRRVLAAAVALVLAPVAVATPESDADGCDQPGMRRRRRRTAARWGPSDGDVYPVGGGFGQNFAGGKIFFTPDTGAHIMAGAILEKYESLGGPADGDLGFPTIDEGPGRVSPDSRNTTFSATDKPVIFWTPDTGAHVVRGAINAAWDKLGGSAGPLGVPTEDEVFNGDVVIQKFTGGELSWNRSAKDVHHRAARAGGTAGRAERPRRRHVGDQRGQAGRRGAAGSARGQAGPAVRDRRRTAPGRTSPAARSSTARPPARTWSAGRS